MKKHNKGFTLTELIIVIVIIGILAGVLIPSLTGYVNKAKTSNDTTSAKNMNTLLSGYYNAQIPDNLEAADVRYAIQQMDAKYTFIPKSASSGYSFWYNQSKKLIQLSKASDLPIVGAADDTFQSLEELVNGYLFLDIGGSELAESISSLRSIKSLSDYEAIENKFDIVGGVQTAFLSSLKGFSNEQKISLKTHISVFSPVRTLYVNDFSSFTSSTNGSVTSIIFISGIVTIPSNACNGIKTITESIKIPESVNFIEPGAFASIENAKDLIVYNFSKLRISKVDDDPTSLDNSFSQVLATMISPNEYAKVKKMRSESIAEIQTVLSYDNDSMETVNNEDGSVLKYIPYNLSIDPRVKVTKAMDGYEVGSEVVIDNWRINYTSMATGAIKMDVKMFDDYGIIATSSVVYNNINDIGMTFSGSTLTFENVARLIYKDETVAEDSASLYKYKIYVGNQTQPIVTEASVVTGTIGDLNIGNAESAYSNISIAQTKLREIFSNAQSETRNYIENPVITEVTSGLWTLTYSFKTSGNANNSTPLAYSKITKTETGSTITRNDIYEIKQDTTKGDNGYYITKTSTESGLSFTQTSVYYYAHNDQSNEENYDSVNHSYSGTQYFITNIYDAIASTNLQEYSSDVVDGKLSIRILLTDQNDQTIIDKTQKFVVDTSSRVYHENISDGQPQQFKYDFSYIPGLIKVDTSSENDKILEDYENLFVKQFSYKGNRTSNIYTGTDEKDEDYNLNVSTSKGFIKLKAKLQTLVDSGMIKLNYGETIDNLLASSYFVKNNAKDGTLGTVGGVSSSVSIKPSIFDPYFLVLRLDDSILGEHNLLLLGIFDQIAGEGNLTATTRMVELGYKVVEPDPIEMVKLNGRSINGLGSESNPFPVYTSEIGNDLYLNGLSICKIKDNGNINLSKELSGGSEIKNYRFVWGTKDDNDIGILKIFVYINNCSMYNYTELYYKDIGDYSIVNITAINERDVSITEKASFYEGENIGLLSVPTDYTLGNTLYNTNIINLAGYYANNDIYQSIIKVGKGSGNYTKYYFIRGDKLPDNATLSSLGLSAHGTIDSCLPNTTKTLTNYYLCDEYYLYPTGNSSIKYYPYMMATPDLTNTSYNYLVPNGFQYFVISENESGQHSYEIFDTSRIVNQSSKGLDQYSAVTKDIEYWINMNLQKGDSGNITFDLYHYYYFNSDSRTVKASQYYYNGMMLANWLLIEHLKGEKAFQVIDKTETSQNIYSAYVNNSNVTFNGGNSTVGKLVFSSNEMIQAKSRTNFAISYPNMLSYHTIYGSNNKNKLYLEVYVDDVKVDMKDDTIFNGKSQGKITFKVNLFGCIFEYSFDYIVADYLDLQLDVILNRNYLGNTVEIASDKKLLNSEGDTYSSLRLYDVNGTISNYRTIYIGDNGVKIEVFNENGSTLIKNIQNSSPYLTLSELGLVTGTTYLCKITYASKTVDFKFKVVAPTSQNIGYFAKMYYINGRQINTSNMNSNQRFYFINNEYIKNVFGYESGNTPTGYSNNGYKDIYWLSAYIYPQYNSSAKAINLSTILGEFNNTSKTFSNVKFYNNNVEMTFEQTYYAHRDYLSSDDTSPSNSIEYSYYYRFSEDVISSTTSEGVLKVEFTYEGLAYTAELNYQTVPYIIDYVNNRTNAYLAPEIQDGSMFTSNIQTPLYFDRDETISFGTTTLNSGYIAMYNRILVRLITSDPSNNGRPTLQDEGSDLLYSRSTGSVPTTQVQKAGYDDYFKNLFTNIKVKVYGSDESSNEVTVWDKTTNTISLKFTDYPLTTHGTIYITYNNEIHYYNFTMRDHVNDEDYNDAKFIRLNNYYLDNYSSNDLQEYDIVDGEYIYLNSSSSQILLPSIYGSISSTANLPKIDYINNSGYYSGYFAQYYLSKVDGDSIVAADYNTNIQYGSTYNPDNFVDSNKWSHLENKTLTVDDKKLWSYGLNVWENWPTVDGVKCKSAILYLIFRNSDENIYKIKIKLNLSTTPAMDMGLRRVNDIYYYDNNAEVIIDKNDLNIAIGTSSVYYKYNSTIYLNATLQTTSKYYYTDDDVITNESTWTALAVNGDKVVLPSSVFIEGFKGNIKINGLSINSVVYNNITFKFVVKANTGEVYRINGLAAVDNYFKVYANELLSTTSVSYITYYNGAKNVIAYFSKYIAEETKNPNFLYYYEISQGLSNSNIRSSSETIREIVGFDEEKNEIIYSEYSITKYTYLWNNIECEVIEDNGKYYYLIPDTSIWSFNEDGILRIVYKPNSTSAQSYVCYANIDTIEKQDNELLSGLYYQLVKTDDNSLYGGYMPLISTSINNGSGTFANPLEIKSSLFTINKNVMLLTIPKSYNTVYRYYRANNSLSYAYSVTTGLTGRVYDVNDDGELIGEGMEFIFDESSLYNGEQFTKVKTIEGYGDVNYTSTKALVLSYTLYGIEYSVTLYYYFNNR